MKKLLILLVMTLSLSAQGLNWAHSYKDAIKKAKVEHKNVMVLITTPTCRWCKRLKRQTLSDKGIIKRLNSGFISVHVTRDNGTYPKELVAKGVPTTYFLYPDGTKIISYIPGHWSIEDYNSWIDDVEHALDRKNKTKKD